MQTFSDALQELGRPESLARLTPAMLAHHASNGRWLPARHLMLVNDAMVRIARGELKNLAIMWPPRHGKSEFVAKYAPAWFVGALGWPVILASYEHNFAASWGRKARDIIRDYGSVFGVTLGQKTSEDWWECSNGGAMMCAGVGGAITGKGGRLLIIDDPVKNDEEANSQTMREKSHGWYDATWLTREEPGAAKILNGTRWHEDDLIGHVLNKGDEAWEVIRLPALAEDDDLLGREPGEALWPERFDEAWLAKRKASVGSYWWGALYQQKPTSEEGAIFKRRYWSRYKALPAAANLGCITVDTAGWEKDSKNDYGVIASWATDGVNFYCRKVQRGRWEFPDFKRRVKDARGEFGYPIVVEETPWARPLIQGLQEDTSGVIAQSVAGRSKENRALYCQPYAEAGNLYLPEEAEWVADFIEEHAQFPNGVHDDQVDTTSAAIRYLGGRVPTPNPDAQPLTRYGSTQQPRAW